MTRSPRDIINAILANLEMAKDAHAANARSATPAVDSGKYWATQDAITLIKTEAATLLAEAKP